VEVAPPFLKFLDPPLNGTPNWVPWRTPFVVPLWGLLYTHGALCDQLSIYTLRSVSAYRVGVYAGACSIIVAII